MNTLATDELQEMLEHNETAVLINVLSEEEFEEAHIPGSINVPLDRDDFVDRVVEIVGDKSRAVVVHGATFKCPTSTAAAQKLEDGGLTHVYGLEGGLEAWLDAKQYVVRPDKTP